MKKKIIAHIKAGLPFEYRKHSFVISTNIITATADEREPGQYFLHARYQFSDGHLSNQPDVCILENLEIKPTIFINSGPFNARLPFDFKKIILLNTDLTPLA